MGAFATSQVLDFVFHLVDDLSAMHYSCAFGLQQPPALLTDTHILVEVSWRLLSHPVEFGTLR